MKAKQIKINRSFIGREYEITRLKKIAHAGRAAIIIMYGRRRVGKTELLEQTFRQRYILKFEGRENQPETQQRRMVMRSLAEYAEETLLEGIQVRDWHDVFKYIYKYTAKGEWTIYFEEVQWLANYQDTFISELKYAWDNYFRHNDKLLVILCGSSPSFMINQVAHSKALYNRSQHEFSLLPFTLQETKLLLKRHSHREIFDAYLSVGGIPLYLDYLSKNSSIFIALVENSFTKDGFFTKEFERIFISSLGENKNYREIVRFLSRKRFATRNEIVSHLKLTSGKNVTELLEDLEWCGFINKYVPYQVHENSKLARYCISDPYLQFYFKFIEPKKKQIHVGRFQENPRSGIVYETYLKWLGYAFERFCRRNDFLLAKILGFSAVNYRSGAFFNRGTIQVDPGYQIGLVFDRDDQVLSICEIRYSVNPVNSKVINEFANKLEYFPNPKKKTIHKVLIASAGATPAVINHGYFDAIITLEDFFTR